MENGHSLHLVARQPAQSQDSSGSGSGETSGNNSHRGNHSVAIMAYHVTKFFGQVILVLGNYCFYMIWQ